jgi:hypothetical protein
MRRGFGEENPMPVAHAHTHVESHAHSDAHAKPAPRRVQASAAPLARTSGTSSATSFASLPPPVGFTQLLVSVFARALVRCVDDVVAVLA